MSENNPNTTADDTPEVAFAGDEEKLTSEQHSPRHADGYQIEDHSDDPPRPAQPNRGPHKSSTQIAHEVYAGKWGDQESWAERVEAAGYHIEQIQHLVSRGVGRPTSR